MKTKTPLSFILATLLALALTSCGQGKSSATSGAKRIGDKLAAVTRAGQPVTTTELSDWYATPPDTNNAAPLYGQAFAALAKDDPKSADFLSRNQKAIELLLQAA